MQVSYFAIVWVSFGVACAFIVLHVLGRLLGVDLVRDVIVACLSVIVTLVLLLWILCMVGSDW